MQLYCKKCNHKLTVTDLQRTFPEEATTEDGEPLIGPGLYINASEIDIHFEKPIDFLLNKLSVNLQNHKNGRLLSGCCGPGNLDALNQVCPNCSAEIGLIFEDCWLPHFIGVSKSAVSEEPLW